MPINISRISEKEYQYVKEVLDTEFRTSKGAGMMRKLEESFAKKFGVNYAVALVNGTATLHAGLLAAGVKPGDEVIVPPLTMSSTAFSVFQVGAIPVFADVDHKTFNIDPESIRKNITSKTKAIMPVALYGLSPDFDPILEIAHEENLIILEDDAECFLGEYKGKLVGTFGDMASFSFQSSKHITSGEGGIIITNNEILANEIRKFSSLGYKGVNSKQAKITKLDIQDPNYERHISVGFNYRISELCAAVSLAQLERIDELVQRRIDVSNEYSKIISQHNFLQPQYRSNDYKNSYWTYACILDSNNVSWHQFRDKFLELGGDGIYSAWKLTYQEPAFKNFSFLGFENLLNSKYFGELRQKYEPGLCPNAEYLQAHMLQFKTNYWNWDRAEEIFSILDKTLSYFESKN